MLKPFVILLTLVLTACGGGGGGGSAADSASVSGSGSSSSSVADIVLPTWTVIADANFERALIAMGLDDTLDGRVLTSNISSVTQLSIRKDYYNPTTASGSTFSSIFSDNGYAYATGTSNLITDVTGLENFKSLRALWIDNQQATNFNFSNMKNLQYLSLWQAPITSIDVSGLTKLRLLGLGETSLTTVNLSALTNLEEVDFQQNNNGVLPYTTTNGTTVTGFASLDFSNNVKLQRIYIASNNLTTIDLSKNTALQELWADYNRFVSVNLSLNTMLSYVILSNNTTMTSLNLRGLSGVPVRLYTENNTNLTSILVTNPAAYTTARDACLTACANNIAIYTAIGTTFN
jgi:hypothetical protein